MTTTRTYDDANEAMRAEIHEMTDAALHRGRWHEHFQWTTTGWMIAEEIEYRREHEDRRRHLN